MPEDPGTNRARGAEVMTDDELSTALEDNELDALEIDSQLDGDSLEFMEELLLRRLTGVLVLVDADELGGELENLADCNAQIFSTDDVSEAMMPAFFQHAMAQLHAGQEVPHLRRQYGTDEDD